MDWTPVVISFVSLLVAGGLVLLFSFEARRGARIAKRPRHAFDAWCVRVCAASVWWYRRAVKGAALWLVWHVHHTILSRALGALRRLEARIEAARRFHRPMRRATSVQKSIFEELAQHKAHHMPDKDR